MNAHLAYTLSLLVELGRLRKDEVDPVHAVLFDVIPAGTVYGVRDQIYKAIKQVRDSRVAAGQVSA